MTGSAEGIPTVLEQIGGQDTVDAAMDIFITEIGPRTPEMVEALGDLLTDPDKSAYHIDQLAFAFGALFGGRGHERVNLKWLMDRHPTPIGEAAFDATAAGALESFAIAGERLEQNTEPAIRAIGAIAQPLKDALVFRRLPGDAEV
jgi:hypothetical protein